MPSRSGGQLVIDSLIANGTDTIFGVPGESYLEALDALYDRANEVRFITCRQEGGAAYMADAYANVTGRLGVCFVTRGPGVTNASIGLHTAFQGSSPVLLLIGQVPQGQMEREAFQEIDYRRMLGEMTKWVAQIEDVDRIPEFFNRAVHVAMSGRPGPVALALPEDVLRALSEAETLPPVALSRAQPSGDDVSKAAALLKSAQKPLIVVGGGNFSDAGRAALHDFAARNHVPVATGFRRHDRFDNTHPCYIGNLGFGSAQPLIDYVKSCDVILAIGTRLADATVRKYSLIEAPKPKQKLVHVLPEAEGLGRVLYPDVPVHCDPSAFAEAINAAFTADNPVWRDGTAAVAKAFRDGLELGPQSGPVDMGEIMKWLRAELPADTIITNGAGNFADWPNRMYTYRAPLTTLAPISGAMGYGPPAAVAAKLAHPDRLVVCFAGDGDFLMNGQELATAVQHGANPIIVVIDNSSYGTIRMHQEGRFPGRVSGTSLTNPDFAAYARAFGAHGETIERTGDFYAAFEAAKARSVPTLLHIKVGPTSFGPDKSLPA